MLRTLSVLACVALAAAAPADTCSAVAAADRVDCYPQPNANQGACEARGCCWVAASPLRGGVGAGQPECFYPQGYGYTASNYQDTNNGFTATLTRSSSTPPSPYGGDIPTLALAVVFESDRVVRVRITDPAASRWEVPVPTTPMPSSKPASMAYDVTMNSTPFSLKITRKADGTVLFDSSVGGLIYSDQFIQLSTRLASGHVTGLGEHVSPLFLDTNWNQVTLWARDQGTPEGQTHNLYGVHPLAYVVEPSGHTHAMFFLNSNAQDFVFQPSPALTWRTIGGIVDFRVILSDDTGPDSVVESYTGIVGRPALPPYWALGFHLCRWGYNSLDQTMKVHAAMQQAKIPQDTQWNDVDAMDNHLDFTYDPVNYKGLPDFVATLHKNGQHYIPIIDPGISNTQGPGAYPAWDMANSSHLWVMEGDKPYWAYVWPGNCSFPDFLNPKTTPYWQTVLSTYHDLVPFDSLWIDMNEIATTGDFQPCPSNKYNTPPYVPGVTDGSLTKKTMCSDAVTSMGRVYNTHSLYGYSEMVATMKALHAIRGKRSIVISRSTFAGAGPHGSHWLGDNTATWDDLYLSIPGLLSFQMFGIPFVGADIGGFNGNSNAELVTRWQQLGAFYPFCRNHNTIGAPAQDPTAFGEVTAGIIRDALLTRYTLLPYLNTLLFGASLNGTMVARPLFFQFPTDANALTVDTQFMWGRGILITPVLQQGATSVTGYFPSADWYSYYDGTPLKGVTSSSPGRNVTLSAPLDTIPVHIRGGSVIPTQEPAVTTTIARTQPYGAIVALDASGAATGTIMMDDGESLTSLDHGEYFKAHFTACGQSVRFTPEHVGWTPTAALGSMRVFGASSVSAVTVNSAAWTSFSFNSTTHALDVSGLSLPMTSEFTISWS